MPSRTHKPMSKDTAEHWVSVSPECVGVARVVVYTMLGGGMLGQSAANDPWSFYIDSRVGRLPYSKRDILRAVRDLAILCDAAKLTRDTMPPMPNFPNLSVF